MLVRWGLAYPLLAPWSFHPWAPLPETVLAVPCSMEAGMLAPDRVTAALPPRNVEWSPGDLLSCVWGTSDCRRYLATVTGSGAHRGEAGWLLLIILR